MDRSKKKRHAEEWALDQKPPKKYRKFANKSERQRSKSEIRGLRSQMMEEEFLDLDAEADEAMYCYKYGPCRKCREAEEDGK
jgi:hypothetical protein